MKKITTLLFALACMFVCNSILLAQTKFNVPANYELVVKEDYAKYEADIIAASKWLEETDLDRDEDKRKEVSAFVMKWIIGSPTVTIDLSEKISKIYGKNTSLLINYMAAYSAYCLQNKSSATKPAATKAGLISMMNAYKKDINIKKSKEMEKLIKLTEENKLEEYIAENFK